MAIDTSSLSVTDATGTPAAAEHAAAGARVKRRRFGVLPTLAIVWLVVLALASIFASYLPLIQSYSEGSVLDGELAPSGAHWFGTDRNGRDVFARCIYGARMSLAIGFFATVLGLGVGGLLGLLSGYYRRRVDGALSVFFDIMLAFPPLLLALAIVIFSGETTSTFGTAARVVIALSVVSIAPLGRLVRANTMVYSQREFVLAARSIGASNRRILFREVLPNVVPPVLTFALTALAVLIVAEASLAFIGISVGLSYPTWGSMIDDGRTVLEDSWWISLFPALVMFLTVFSINLLGDVLSGRFNVKETIG